MHLSLIIPDTNSPWIQTGQNPVNINNKKMQHLIISICNWNLSIQQLPPLVTFPKAQVLIMEYRSIQTKWPHKNYASNPIMLKTYHGSVGCRSTDFTLSDLWASFLWSSNSDIKQSTQLTRYKFTQLQYVILCYGTNTST